MSADIKILDVYNIVLICPINSMFCLEAAVEGQFPGSHLICTCSCFELSRPLTKKKFHASTNDVTLFSCKPTASMPKPSKGQSSKKASPAVGNGEDTSFIVFSNSKSDAKGKKKAATPPEAPVVVAKGKGKMPASATDPSKEEQPKKPDTRTLIGGASWTGKLPVNMLSEHCQKMKWEKPEWTMVWYIAPSVVTL